MKKIFLSLALVLVAAPSFASTPFRFIVNDQGAHVEFATATVNGLAVFDGQEFSAVEKFEKFKNGSAIIQNYTPQTFEINISTCVLKFENGSDFQNCLVSKEALKRKIKALRREINEADPGDLPDLQQRLDYLKSYKQSLP